MAQKLPGSLLPDLIKEHEKTILAEWESTRHDAGNSGIGRDEVARYAKQFLAAVRESMQSGGTDDIQSPEWERTRDVLTDISGEQSRQGTSVVDVATFILSVKEPIFARLQAEHASDPAAVAREIWETTRLVDKLALFTTSVALKAREELIGRQQAEMLELSTPVVKLWDGILALPLIGTIDSERTQVVMENLLQEIVHTGAGIAIIDITGVPTVDTLVAQHLLKTVAAARLMGAECIISGIRPQIASTIVHLGVDLGDVSTKATLADAFKIALQRNGMRVAPVKTVRLAAGE